LSWGEIVINEIISTLIEEKISIAQRGEFTKRAYLNGKMELLKAESIDKIITSNSKKTTRNCAQCISRKYV